MNSSAGSRPLVQIATGRPRPRQGKIRLLLACPAWPSGILDVGSWAEHEGLADVLIFQMQPGYLFALPADDRSFLAAGPVDSEIVDSLARLGRRLSPEAIVRSAAAGTWEIDDPSRHCTYRIIDAGRELDVFIPANFEDPQFAAAIRQYAHRSGRGEQLLAADGSLSQPARQALLAVGGQMVVKLIELAPHVVGFRIEGGGFDDVRRYVQATRLFCDAEVILGGPTATSHASEVLDDCGADYVFAGEAEEPLNQFLRMAWIRDGRDRLAEIPGLTYRYGNRSYHNTLPRDGYGRNVVDVDRAICGMSLHCARNAVRPLADSSVVQANRLRWSLLENFQREFDSLFFTGGRGCPGACTFCAKLHGQELRIKSAAQILEEIEAADALVQAGRLSLTRWDLFKHVDRPEWQSREAAWAAIYDEDFFLNRRRAIEFFRLWDAHPLSARYRISLQTNPCSMLASSGSAHAELLGWIDRVKPMVQLGAESFNHEVLSRWRKRHNLRQLTTVLDALDATGQDYTVFQLLTDFDTTAEELVESLRLLVLDALRRPKMRIASGPFTYPLYDSETREILEFRGQLPPQRVAHFTDYERPQPGWMDPLVADLANLADAELQWGLLPERRDAALLQAVEVVRQRLVDEARGASDTTSHAGKRQSARLASLCRQASRALSEVKDAWFQRAGSLGR